MGVLTKNFTNVQKIWIFPSTRIDTKTSRGFYADNEENVLNMTEADSGGIRRLIQDELEYSQSYMAT